MCALQLDEYITFLETHCQQTFDHDRLAEVGRLSMAGQRLWQQVLDTNGPSTGAHECLRCLFSTWPLIVTPCAATQTVVDYLRSFSTR